MHNKQEYMDFLTKERRTRDFEKVAYMLGWLEARLGDGTPIIEAIDALVRDMWGGYVSRDKNTFQILSNYAEFCKDGYPAFYDGFSEYVRQTFEGDARKAVRAFRNGMVLIPDDVQIAGGYLCGLDAREYVAAFRALQEFFCEIYNAVAEGSPFEWGWPDWKELTFEGIVHNRVVLVLHGMVQCSHVENDILIVDKNRFMAFCKKAGLGNVDLLLKGFSAHGMNIVGLGDELLSVSFSMCTGKKSGDPKGRFREAEILNNRNIIAVLWSYFARPSTGDGHIRYFSYRFAEDPATQTHETLFLAKTDSEPAHIREIYYWSYAEAVRHGFVPMGEEKIFCYLFKKRSKEWLLLGKGSSYHEEEFLHSVDYTISAKFAFPKIFHKYPEKIAELKRRFPLAFATRWGVCHSCKADLHECKYRIDSGTGFRCMRGTHFFHNPSFEDVKFMLELYKLENNIKLI